MHCPFCQHEDTRVIDSRLTEDGNTVRRRRECPQCGERREPFDEDKLRVSFERALQKRPVTSEAVDAAMHRIVDDLRKSSEREVASRQVGELVMRELKQLDQVAYVRFASVYRKFEDVHAFREEIEKLERDLPGLDDLQLPLLGGGKN
jgi:transcriptional repressor NrdR